MGLLTPGIATPGGPGGPGSRSPAGDERPSCWRRGRWASTRRGSCSHSSRCRPSLLAGAAHGRRVPLL